MAKIKIDDRELEVADGISILKACEIAGIEVPRFCYHEKLSIAGNCRMCLVEIEKAPKPVASCAMPVSDKMVIKTNTPNIKKAREGVMELLLINHPLDCPVCDQGGECDLQEQSFHYGRSCSRFREEKRLVENKDLGPLIKTCMNRCIHCMRCVRFASEIAGTPEIGAVGRGEHTEILTQLSGVLTSEVSGNLIDVCPVGALTAKPYAYKFRSWELKKTDSIDIMDAVGSNIRIDSRGFEIMRIAPRYNENINETWLADRSRFVQDGLSMNRLDRPLLKNGNNLTQLSWTDAFKIVRRKMEATAGKRIGTIVGEMADTESMFILKTIMQEVDSPNLDCRPLGMNFTSHHRGHYLFNSTIAGVDKADLCLFIGANPRYEATAINMRIRKNYLKRKLPVFSIGQIPEQTYPVEILGKRLNVLESIYTGSSGFVQNITKAHHPMLIVGSNILTRPDGKAILAYIHKIAKKYNLVRDDWNGINILHKSASIVAGLDLGIVPGREGLTTSQQLDAARKGKLSILYLLGVDEINIEKTRDCFVIYQGHHGDRGASIADIIFPGAAYSEKNATYVNLEGRPQTTKRVVPPPGAAMEDWATITEFANNIGITIPYNSVEELREDLYYLKPHFAKIGEIAEYGEWEFYEDPGHVDIDIDQQVANAEYTNYYQINPIMRSSATLIKRHNDFNPNVKAN